MNPDVLKQALIVDEGYKTHPYKDTVGKITIGIGHNLTDNGLSTEILNLIYERDMGECLADLKGYQWYEKLNETRQHVVLNMRFQLGPTRFRAFKNFIRALEIEAYDRAAFEMAASAWAGQVPSRAQRLIAEMKTGRTK